MPSDGALPPISDWVDISDPQPQSSWSDLTDTFGKDAPETAEVDAPLTTERLSTIPLHKLLPRPTRQTIAQYVNQHRVPEPPGSRKKGAKKVPQSAGPKRKTVLLGLSGRHNRADSTGTMRKKSHPKILLDVSVRRKRASPKSGPLPALKPVRQVSFAPDDHMPENMWDKGQKKKKKYQKGDDAFSKRKVAPEDDFSQLSRPKPRAWLRNAKATNNVYSASYDPTRMTQRLRESAQNFEQLHGDPLEHNTGRRKKRTEDVNEARELFDALQYVYNRLPSKQGRLLFRELDAQVTSLEEKRPPGPKAHSPTSSLGPLSPLSPLRKEELQEFFPASPTHDASPKTISAQVRQAAEASARTRAASRSPVSSSLVSPKVCRTEDANAASRETQVESQQVTDDASKGQHKPTRPDDVGGHSGSEECGDDDYEDDDYGDDDFGDDYSDDDGENVDGDNDVSQQGKIGGVRTEAEENKTEGSREEQEEQQDEKTELHINTPRDTGKERQVYEPAQSGSPSQATSEAGRPRPETAKIVEMTMALKEAVGDKVPINSTTTTSDGEDHGVRAATAAEPEESDDDDDYSDDSYGDDFDDE